MRRSPNAARGSEHRERDIGLRSSRLAAEFAGVPEGRDVGAGFWEGGGDGDFFEVGQNNNRHDEAKRPARSTGKEQDYRGGEQEGRELSGPGVITGEVLELEETCKDCGEIAEKAGGDVKAFLSDDVGPEPPGAPGQGEAGDEIGPAIEFGAEFGGLVEAAGHQTIAGVGYQRGKEATEKQLELTAPGQDEQQRNESEAERAEQVWQVAHSGTVLYAAAIGPGLAHFHFFACFQFFDGFADVVAGGAWVVGGGRAIVNGALIDEDAVLINDEHVGSGTHAVFFSELAGVVVNPGGGLHFLLGPFPFCRFWAAVAGTVRAGRVDEQPDHAFGGHRALEFLHSAGAEMIVAERAIEIVGFEDDNLAFVIAEFVCFAFDVLGGEVRGGLADLGCG